MGSITSGLGHTAVLFQIIIAILWLPTYVPANVISPDGAGAVNDNTTCTKPECDKMADTIKKQMGTKPPCEDFHDYVCEKWKGDRELKTARLKKKAVLTLIDLLNKDSWKPPQVSNATKKLIRAYKSCTNKGKDKNALRTSIGNVIARYDVTNKTWPIIEETKMQSPQRESDDYVEVLKNTGPRPVFSYSVYNQNGKPVLLMTKPSEFYAYETEESGSMIMSDGEETSDSTTDDYAGYNDLLAGEERAYKEFINKTIFLLNDSISKEDADNVVEGIVMIEKGLSKLANAETQADRQNMTLLQLGTQLGNTFPMTEILQTDFQGLNININGSTEVLVDYVKYFKGAVNLMKCSTTASLTNYLMWTKIRKMAEAKGTLLHEIYLQFKHNTSTLNSTDAEDSYSAGSAKKARNISLYCVHQLLESDVMYTAVANYYIMAKFNESFKKDVVKMMKFINDSFMNVVHNIWMSEPTRNAVIMKLQNLTAIIGYPEWMLNDTIITALYQYVPGIRKNASFVEHFHHLLENDFKQSLLQLVPGRYFNKTNEDIPLRSHAYYAGGTNTMVYPAASIVTHYRDSPIPRSVNYGTIGTILGQLLTKLIDRYDDLSSETGKYNVNTWDNTTRDNFCNMSSCLNHTEECNDTEVASTGKYEKLHDYYGVRISYQAMQKSKQNYKPPFLLPDANKTFDTEEKIFFILFGSLYCPYSIHEGLVESRADEEEKFPKSLNEIVYNYEAFNKTFGCPLVGKDECDLMPPEPKKPEGC